MENYEHAVSALLKERSDVLVCFCEILVIDDKNLPQIGNYLKKFSQLLTDYSALGHFEVIEPLLSRSSNVEDGELSAAIRETTDYILKFSDDYSPESANGRSLAELSSELDELGVRLAERFEMEDRLLSRA